MCVCIDAISNAVVAVTAVGSSVFAIYQWLQHKKIYNEKMLFEFSKVFEQDSAIALFVRKIDYGETWYSDGKFHDSTFEKTADYALSTLCFFVKLIEDKVIKEKDFHALNYVLDRTLKNRDTQAYFKFLIDFTRRCQNEFPFEPLLRYGRRKHLLSEDFDV